MPGQKNNLVKKVCILGDPGVGKTSLIRRFVLDEFDDGYLTTLGAKVSEKRMTAGGAGLTLAVWDIAGQKAYTAMGPALYEGAQGALAVCDLTRQETFENLHAWVRQLRDHCPGAVVVVVVNKSDLGVVAAFPVRLAETFAASLGTSAVLSSAKTGANVEEAFRLLAERMVGGRRA